MLSIFRLLVGILGKYYYSTVVCMSVDTHMQGLSKTHPLLGVLNFRYDLVKLETISCKFELDSMFSFFEAVCTLKILIPQY